MKAVTLVGQTTLCHHEKNLGKKNRRHRYLLEYGLLYPHFSVGLLDKVIISRFGEWKEEGVLCSFHG